MSGNKNIQICFDKIISIALRELENPALHKDTITSLEEIIALARYQFDITTEKKS